MRHVSALTKKHHKASQKDLYNDQLHKTHYYIAFYATSQFFFVMSDDGYLVKIETCYVIYITLSHFNV